VCVCARACFPLAHAHSVSVSVSVSVFVSVFVSVSMSYGCVFKSVSKSICVYLCVYVYVFCQYSFLYGAATISRLLKIISLFGEYRSLL